MSALSTLARKMSGFSPASGVLLVALIGIISGFVQFSGAAARRTETSYDRFVEWSEPATLAVGGTPEGLGPIGDVIARIAVLPGVEHWARMEAVSAYGVELTPGRLTTAPRLNVVSIGDNSSGDRLGGVKLLEGHIP